jgi:hypothetical protein
MKPKSFVLAATLLVLFFASSLMARPAYACSCSYFPTEEQAWTSADVVFIGKVTRAGISPRQVTSGTRMEDFASILDVQSVSKGQLGSSVTIRGLASCTYPFKQSGIYRVYAYYTPGDSGKLYTGICSGNKVMSEPVVDPAVEGIRPGTLFLYGVAAGALILGVFVFWPDRRQSK